MKNAVLFIFFALLYVCAVSQTSVDYEGISTKQSFSIGKYEGISTKQSFSIGKYAKGIPYLSTTQKFVEPNGNSLLDANETSYIEITIKNSGAGSAYNVIVNNAVDNSTNISYDKNAEVIKEIKSGETKTVKLYISGKSTLIDGQKKFSVTFSESGNFIAAPFTLIIQTQKLLTPLVSFNEVGIEEIQGNKDNIIAQGELIRLSVLVQNKGLGIAEGTTATLIIEDKNIMAITGTYSQVQTIGVMKSGESKILYFDITPTWGYTGSDLLPVYVELSENKKLYGGKYNLNLQMNVVTISGETINIEGQYTNNEITEASLTSEIDKDIPVSKKKYNNRYCLIIGNENYVKNEGLEADVTFALNDALIFKQYAQKTLGIPDANIIYLQDANSKTMSSKIEAFSKTIAASVEADEFFVYYAGHGYPDENGEPYLMPVDVKYNELYNAIKLSDFYSKLTGGKTKKVSIFLDACFSGGGRTGLDLVAERSGVKIKTKSTTPTSNLFIFAATTGDQTAKPYKDMKHGLFTYYLLKTIQDKNGNIDYNTLTVTVISEVKKTSYMKDIGEQVPTVNISPSIETTWKSWKIGE